MNNSNLTILHAFDPKKQFLPPKNGEVRFVQGKYIDIAAKKGKDKNSLYFGTSKNTNLLTGIFLGDTELTSRVKDVSLVNKNNNIILSVKYINEENKLATVKTTLLSPKSIGNITSLIEGLNDRLSKIDTSISKIIKNINIINSSVNKIETHLNIIDTSIDNLISELNDGIYNYTISESIGSFNDGCVKTYTLFKGGHEQTDSSVITINDYVLKKLDYDTSTNKLIAFVWPEACEDMYQYQHIIDADGNDNLIKTGKLKDEYVKTIELNLDSLETHIIDTINTNSIINTRLTYVENQLKWEELFNN